MKKILLFLTVSFISFSLLAPIASAHVLVTDKNIGAVMHTDPDDDPIAGQQTGIFFEFKDTTGKFKPENCACKFLITEHGNTIYSQRLFQNTDTANPNNASIFFTFPKRDVYQVVAIGKPTISGAFQPFTLTYEVRVDKVAGTKDASEKNETDAYPVIFWIGVFFVTVMLIAFVIYKKRKNKAI